jgi:dTDP-glucose 4,6-dehydratase/UDP-glucuronate decarboxylase
VNKFIKDICNGIFQNCDTSDFKNKSILITGANGLIGGFLADFFCYLNESHNYNIKLFLTSLSEKPNRLINLLDYPYVSYIQKDLSIADWSNFNEIIDYCFYCAGYAQPSKFIRQNISTLFLNTVGLQRTFDNIFKKYNEAKCVFLSSSELYATNGDKDFHKESDIINISVPYKRNFYLVGKLSGEIIVNNFREMGYDVKSVRVSTIYGPGHGFEDERVLSDLTRKAVGKSEYIDLFDDGLASRKYQHISDCCIMLFNILLYGNQEVYNVGGKEETTIYEMAKIIGNKFNKEVVKGKVNNDVALSAPKKVSISLDRYNSEFCDFDFIPFKDGIENYLNWYKEKYENLC